MTLSEQYDRANQLETLTSKVASYFAAHSSFNCEIYQASEDLAEVAASLKKEISAQYNQ